MSLWSYKSWWGGPLACLAHSLAIHVKSKLVISLAIRTYYKNLIIRYILKLDINKYAIYKDNKERE